MDSKEVITLPLHMRLDAPDKNGRILPREVVEKALADKKFEEMGGIPVTIMREPDNIVDACTINPKMEVGFAKVIDLDNMQMNVHVSNPKLAEAVKDFLKEAPEQSFGIRGITKYEEDGKGNTVYNDLKLISFNLVGGPNSEP